MSSAHGAPALDLRSRVQVLGFGGVRVLRFRVLGSGCLEGLGLRVEGLGV